MFPGDDTSNTYIHFKIDILIFKGTNCIQFINFNKTIFKYYY